MPNIVIGLVAIALGLWGLSVWWWSVAELLRGLVPVALVLFGIVAVGAGVSITREKGEKDTGDDDLMSEEG